jgi:hypothetical protein
MQIVCVRACVRACVRRNLEDDTTALGGTRLEEAEVTPPALVELDGPQARVLDSLTIRQLLGDQFLRVYNCRSLEAPAARFGPVRDACGWRCCGWGRTC